MIKKLNFLFNIFFIYFFLTNTTFADLQTDLINKLSETNTLSINYSDYANNVTNSVYHNNMLYSSFIDGGIKSPRVPDPARVPKRNLSG